MKISSKNTCCLLLVSLLLAIAATALFYCGMLPSLLCYTLTAVHLTAAMLAILFIMAALGGCHCLRKFSYTLCRYGCAFVVALISALLLGFALLAVYDGCLTLCVFILVFFAVWAFLFAVMMLAIILTTMLGLGCPRCTPPETSVPRSCIDPPYEET